MLKRADEALKVFLGKGSIENIYSEGVLIYAMISPMMKIITPVTPTKEYTFSFCIFLIRMRGMRQIPSARTIKYP